jgi:hypothetical protein
MGYKSFLSYLVFSAVFVALAVVAGVEFSALPYDGTWGSDAQYYYTAASGHGGESSCGAYLGYGYVCTFTAFLNIVDLPMAFYGFIGLLYIYVICKWFGPRGAGTSTMVWMVIAFNPIVIWTFLKGVKEGFVILFLMVLVNLYGRVIRSKKITDVALLVVAVWVVSTVKFEAVAFFVLAALSTELIMRSRNRVRTAAIFVALSILSLFVLDQLETIFPEVAFLKKLMAHQALFFNEEIDQADAKVNYLLAVIRFLTGPGPITPLSSLFADTGFYEPTVIGKVLIFLGSIFWLSVLALSVLGIKKAISGKLHRQYLGTVISRESVFPALMAFFYVLTYAFMYGGMVDTRHRAVVYALLLPILAPLSSLGLKIFAPSTVNEPNPITVHGFHGNE